MKRALPFCISLLFIFAAACQPTPAAEAVRYQKDDFMKSVVISERFVRVNAPARIEQSFAHSPNGLEVRFAAAVDVPEVEKYAIIETERAELSQEHIRNAVNRFMPGAALIQDITLTRQQWMTRITYYKLHLGDRDPGYVDAMQDQMASAPEAYTPSPFLLNKLKSNEEFTALSHNGDDTYAMISGVMDGNQFYYTRDYEAYCAGEDTIDSSLDPALLEDYKGDFPITAEAALPIAVEALSAIGFPDAELIGTQKTCSYKFAALRTRGWEFTFTHGNNGLPNVRKSEAVTYGGDGLPLPSLCSPWGQESITISVDGDGVICIDVKNAVRYKQELAHNIILLDFEALLACVEKHLSNTFFYLPERLDDAAVIITRMELCSAMVAAKDDTNTGRLIPAWRVSFTCAGKVRAYTDDAGEYHPAQDFSDSQSRYFSAIDGNYIEPRITSDYIG